MFILVGLGNPGVEYENTRHNTGALVLEVFRKSQGFPAWAFDKKLNALISRGSVFPSSSKVKSQKSAVLLKPQTFMNKSGEAVRQIKDLRFKIKGKTKEIPNLAVIHDDLDIPFGKYKISFNKSSGGHKGVESIIRAVKTQAFMRVRVGLSPRSSFVKGGVPHFSGKVGDGGFNLKKSSSDAAVEKLILGNFTPAELSELKKLAKRISEGLTCFITEGREKAMSQFN